MHFTFRFLKIFLSLSFLLLINLPAHSQEALREANKPIERELKGGEEHSYSINLSVGQYLAVTTEQKGIDVVVRLFAPDGKKLEEVDAPTGPRGMEVIQWITSAAGEYRLEISALEGNAPAGRYEVVIRELRASTPKDPTLLAYRKASEEGKQFESGGDLRKALGKFEEALPLSRHLGDQWEEADTLNNIGRVSGKTGALTKALENLQASLRLSEENNYKKLYPILYTNLGIVYSIQGMVPQSAENLEKALAIYEAAGDRVWVTRILGNFGQLYSNIRDVDRSIEYFLRAVAQADAIDFKEPPLLEYLQGIADSYSRKGDYARALFYYERALKENAVYGGPVKAAELSNNIGLVHESQGNYEQAIEYFMRAKEIFEPLSARLPGFCLALLNIGRAYSEQGNFEKALEYTNQGLEIAEKNNYRNHGVMARQVLGSIYQDQGDYPRALEYFRRTEEAPDAVVRENIAEIYLLQKNYKAALDYGLEAENRVNKNAEIETYWRILLTQGKAYLGLADVEKARQTLAKSISIIETLRSQTAGGEGERERSFTNKLEPYKAMAELLIAGGDYSGALNYAERAKSRALLDVLQTGKINLSKEMSAAETNEENELKSAISSLNSRIENARQATPSENDSLAGELNKKRLAFENFRLRLYAMHPELQVRRGEMKPIALDQINALLADTKSALIEYTVTQDKAFLYVSTTAEFKVYPISVTQKSLTAMTESFRSKLANGDLDSGKDARELYELLLKPAAAQLSGKTNLIIVPDDCLWDMPFQALQDGKGKYLIESAAVSYAPSLTALREMKRKSRAKRAENELLAFGNPAVGKETSESVKRVFMGEKLEPLPEAERMVNSLKQMYGGRAEVFTGAEASEEKAKEEAPKFRIVQFATHGILNDASPMYSHIVLARKEGDPNEDGLLEAWEMKDLDLHADLVILSACDTARGKVSSGEGMIGMTWAMFIAGAPATVASQWKVESSSTTELMLEFHRQMLADKKISKAEALRRASLKLLKSTKYKHPSYWAGFVLVGDGS